MSLINLAKIDFNPSNSGGGQKPEVVLNETITENGQKTFNPPTGSVYSSATINVNVPTPTIEANKTQSVTANGPLEILPSEGNDAMAKVTLDVNVPTSGGEYTYKEGDNLIYVPGEYKLFDGSNLDVYINNENLGESKTYNFEKEGIYNVLFKVTNKYSSSLGSVFADSKLYYIFLDPEDNYDYNTNCYRMFENCKNLITFNLFGTSNVTHMNYMFYNCSSLTTIPQLDTSKVTIFEYMFSDCSSLTTIPQLDTSNATNMVGMFNECSSLTTIPQLDTSKVANMTNMFYNCTNLEKIEGLDFSSLTYYPRLFREYAPAYNLNRFILNGVLNFSVLKSSSLLSYCADELDYDTIKSWLTAASKSEKSGLTLDFATNANNARTIADQEGELAALVQTCTGKGWIIQNLTIS